MKNTVFFLISQKILLQNVRNLLLKKHEFHQFTIFNNFNNLIFNNFRDI